MSSSFSALFEVKKEPDNEDKQVSMPSTSLKIKDEPLDEFFDIGELQVGERLLKDEFKREDDYNNDADVINFDELDEGEISEPEDLDAEEDQQTLIGGSSGFEDSSVKVKTNSDLKHSKSNAKRSSNKKKIRLLGIEPVVIGDPNRANKPRSTAGPGGPQHCVHENCSKSFPTKYQLKRHQISHSSEARSFKCDRCPAAFNRSTHLNSHIKTKHERSSNFVCPVCGENYHCGRDLSRHVATHTGERPFQCEHCDRGFASKDNLVVHLRIHTGEKPFRCSYCSREFSRKSNLDVHVRLHSDERPFECGKCGKGFAVQSNRKRHEAKYCHKTEVTS